MGGTQRFGSGEWHGWYAVLLSASIAFLTLLMGSMGAQPTDAQASVPQDRCGSLQELVNRAAAGSVVQTPGGCIYREAVTVGKPLTLKAGPGTEIRGSDVWGQWRGEGGAWVSEKSVPAFETHPDMASHGRCKPGTSRCWWMPQVFVNGEPLKQVNSSRLAGGQFTLDAQGRVVLGADPAGRLVEVSVRQFWVRAAAAGVTVQGFTMKHAANSGQTGALTNAGRNGFSAQGNNLSWAHGANLNLTGGADLKAINNDIHHSGQVGVLAWNSEATLVDNRIHHNNVEGFDPYWAAGGVKATDMRSLVAEGNGVFSNVNSAGIWCDQNCQRARIRHNRIHHNGMQGIHYEISRNAVIARNTIWENGWGQTNQPGLAGVLVSSSRDVAVRYNTLAWNKSGVEVVSSDRDGTAYDHVTAVRVHHNTMLAKDYADSFPHFALGWTKAWSGSRIYQPSSGNRGYINRYWYATPVGSKARYRWSGDSSYSNLTQLSKFNATRGESLGKYLSKDEKDRVVAARNIPASPEH